MNAIILTPKLIVVVLLVLMLFALIVISWVMLFIRSRKGIPPVAYEPRHPVPWSGGMMVFLVFLYLVAQLGAGVLVRSGYERDIGPLPVGDEAMSNLPLLIRLLHAHTVANLSLLVVAILLLVVRSGATLKDLGLSLDRFWRDLWLGGKAFVLIVPPILLIQAALTYFVMKSTHPLIEGWRNGGSEELLLWTIMAAVIQAPLVEEFFFRGVLQGWLEAVMKPDPAAPVVEVSPPDDDGLPPLDEVPAEFLQPPVEAPAQPLWLPIWVSALVFALAHIGSGPDPIPIFVLALGLGYLYRQTHRLWPGIVLHMLLNGFSTLAMAIGAGEQP